jgi:DNA polymerase III sliding clamp (beta) subunit (PCNA family)
MALVKPAIPKKTTLPVTTRLYMGNGQAIATDLETAIIVNVPEAMEPMLLPYSQIAEMLKYINGNDTLKIELEGKVVKLSWDGGGASYPTDDAAEFPVLPELKVKADALINGDALLAAMKFALPYAATEDSRPTLKGVTLVLGNPIEVAAGDGFRACHQVMSFIFPSEEQIIIPSHAVAIMEHVFDKTPRTPPSNTDSIIDTIISKRMVHMSITEDNKLRMDFGTSASLVINLVSGTPPKWITLIPTGETILQSQLFAPQLEAAVKRVKTIAKEGSGIVRLEFAEGKVKVSAKGADNEISTTIDAILTQGEPGRTAINQKYLLDYLNGKTSIITMSKFTDAGPLVFEYGRSPKVLIMPMQVGDESKKTEEPVADIHENADEAEAGTDEVADAEGSGEVVAEAEAVAEQTSVAVAEQPAPVKVKRARKNKAA